MMELWNEDIVRFMRDASEYGTYNQELANLLSANLNSDMHICDAGSGLGYLSLALAPYVKKITSVDINPDVTAVLKKNCSQRRIKNIIPCCGMIQEMVPAKKYDAMVFCFFGSIEEILEIAKEQCSGTVFIITRTYTKHRFSVGEHLTGSFGYYSCKETMVKRGVPFDAKFLGLEFGQPFRSFADARRFYEIYSKDEEKTAITDKFLRSKVIKTGEEKFPLYMPHLRNLAILKFEASNIPDNNK